MSAAQVSRVAYSPTPHSHNNSSSAILRRARTAVQWRIVPGASPPHSTFSSAAGANADLLVSSGVDRGARRVSSRITVVTAAAATRSGTATRRSTARRDRPKVAAALRPWARSPGRRNFASPRLLK